MSTEPNTKTELAEATGPEPDVVICVTGGVADIQVLTVGVRAELREYDDGREMFGDEEDCLTDKDGQRYRYAEFNGGDREHPPIILDDKEWFEIACALDNRGYYDERIRDSILKKIGPDGIAAVTGGVLPFSVF